MYFEEFQLGQQLTLEPVTVDAERMLAFAREYDNIPLHTDADYAAKTPFGQIIAPGMFTFLEVWANYLKADLFGEELLAGKSSRIEWHKPVFAGDRLTGHVTVTALTPRNPQNGTVELTLVIENQAQIPVLTNVTEAIVKRRCT